MAEAEQFSLRWNNFHSNLSEGFHSLLEEVDLVDVTLAADGQYLQAHKIVLSVCSPYFKQLFKANPCKHPIVILKDVCHKDLQALLQFMYQGEVNVRQEELAPFLKTAEMLQIKGLTGSDTNSKVPTDHVSESSLKPTSPVQRIGRNVCKTETPSGAELSSPPFKRQRTSSPVIVRSLSPSPSAPLVSPLNSASTSQSLATNTENSSPAFVPIPEPKLEPLEYDAETDDMKDSPTELVQLLQSSESSQPSSEHTSAAPVLFSSVAGLPQDSGGSQDSMQGRTAWNSADRNVRCPQCPRVFSYYSNLKVHIRDAHSGPQHFTCHLCGRHVKNYSCLRVHLYRKHQFRTTKVPEAEEKIVRNGL